MENKEKSSKGSTIESLLEKNIQWTQAVYEQNKSIKRRLLYMVILGYTRVALILIPLIAAFIFLPPYIQELWNQVTSILDMFTGGSSFSLNDFFEALQNTASLSK